MLVPASFPTIFDNNRLFIFDLGLVTCCASRSAQSSRPTPGNWEFGWGFMLKVKPLDVYISSTFLDVNSLSCLEVVSTLAVAEPLHVSDLLRPP